jgi:glycosyltransferase involved in cell wall biosynthesis
MKIIKKANPLRLLIAVDAERTPDGAAVPHVYATQVEFLQRAGNEVRLFGVDDRTSPRGIRRNLRELTAEIARFRADLVVAYYGTMVAAISRLAARRTPFIVTFRGSDLQGTSNPGWKWRLRDRLGRMLSLFAGAGAKQIVVNGSGLLNALPKSLRHKAHNLPNGINTEIFSPIPRDEARRRLGWPLEEKVILFNAGIDSGQVVKNRPLAEAAISRLGPSRRGLALSAVEGVRMEAISRCTREEVALRLNASDCLLLTSLHEGSPDLVKEAMACDLPVVSVPCGDVPERLEGVEPGGVRPYDAGQLAEALEAALWSGRRSNGREQLFKQGLDIVSVTERVLNVYRMAAQ